MSKFIAALAVAYLVIGGIVFASQFFLARFSFLTNSQIASPARAESQPTAEHDRGNVPPARTVQHERLRKVARVVIARMVRLVASGTELDLWWRCEMGDGRIEINCTAI